MYLTETFTYERKETEGAIHPSGLRWASCPTAYDALMTRKIISKSITSKSIEFGNEVHKNAALSCENSVKARNKLIETILTIPECNVEPNGNLADCWEFHIENHISLRFAPLSGIEEGPLVAGTPDLVVVNRRRAIVVVIEYKTGARKKADSVQLQAYMRMAHAHYSPDYHHETFGILLNKFRTHSKIDPVKQPGNIKIIDCMSSNPMGNAFDAAVYRAAELRRGSEEGSMTLWESVGENCTYCPVALFPCKAVTEYIWKVCQEKFITPHHFTRAAVLTKRIYTVLTGIVTEIMDVSPETDFTSDAFTFRQEPMFRLKKVMTADEWLEVTKDWLDKDEALSYIPLTAAAVRKAVRNNPLEENLRKFANENIKKVNSLHLRSSQ